MNFDCVKKEFLEELNRIRDTAPKPREVEDAKTYLVGSQSLRSTSAEVAGQMLTWTATTSAPTTCRTTARR